MIRRRTALAGLVAAPSLAAPRIAAAQAGFPNRAIRVVVPFAAGGGTDASTRIWAARMSEIAGQQFIIDNRGGSGGNVGQEQFVRSVPDGYTIMVTSNGPLTVNRYLYRDMNHDPLRDLLPTATTALPMTAGLGVRMETPGGAGLGMPARRSPDALAADILDGKVSRAAAERDYGAGRVAQALAQWREPT